MAKGRKSKQANAARLAEAVKQDNAAKQVANIKKFGTLSAVGLATGTVVTAGNLVAERAYGATGTYVMSGAEIVGGGLLIAFSGPIGVALGVGLVCFGSVSVADSLYSAYTSGRHELKYTKNLLGKYTIGKTILSATDAVGDIMKPYNYEYFSTIANNNPTESAAVVTASTWGSSLFLQKGRDQAKTILSYAPHALGFSVAAATTTSVPVIAEDAYGVEGLYGVSGLAIASGAVAMVYGGPVIAVLGAGVAVSGILSAGDGLYSAYTTGKHELTITRRILPAQALDYLKAASTRLPSKETIAVNANSVIRFIENIPYGTGSAAAGVMCFMLQPVSAIGVGALVAFSADLGGAYHQRGDFSKASIVIYPQALYYASRRVWNGGMSTTDVVHNLESIKNTQTQFGFKCFETLYLNYIRNEYTETVAALRYSVLAKVNSNLSLANSVNFCTNVSQEKVLIKQEFQLKSPFLSVVPMFARQLDKYGNYTGITEGDINSRCAANATDVLFSAIDTNDSDLGIEENNTYSQRLKVARALNFKVMPQNITPQYLECALDEEGNIVPNLGMCEDISLN